MRRHVSVLLVAVAPIIVVAGCVQRPPAADDGRSPRTVDARARAADIPLPPEMRIVTARVAAGATLASVLREHQVAPAQAADLVARATAVFDVRKVRAAQPYRLEQAAGGVVRRFEYEIDGDRLLRVTRSTATTSTDSAYVAEVLPIPKTRAIEVVRGRIDRRTPSLFSAMDAAGEAVELSIGLADIFSGELDFNTDLQPGDRFELLVEKQYREPHAFAGYGPIVAAELDNAGRRYRAVRFTPPGSAPAYYDDRGVSMRRFLLHSPLKFQPVVSSRFSRSRLHPVLREYRPHLGVDYKAPFGAPVIASADGVVVEAGMRGGAGRMVHLRHAGGFESEYLHLSAIAVRAGAHVHQGDLIGRVGASGLATGPHLDYRLKKNGVFINPLTAQRAMPPAAPVPAAQLAAFGAARDAALAELAAASARAATLESNSAQPPVHSAADRRR